MNLIHTTDDGCLVELNAEIDREQTNNNQETVEYTQYGGLNGYVAFTDDSGDNVTYSTKDIDSLIGALKSIQARELEYLITRDAS